MTGPVPLEIEPLELARRLEAGEPIQVLDVRSPERLLAGRVEPVQAERFLNVRGSVVVQMRDAAEELGLVPSDPIVVVCGHGNDSRVIAMELGQSGYLARSLRGGIAAWMRVVVPREQPPPAGFDRLVQLDRVGKGALGYFLASAGEALVIDPSRDLGPYHALASESEARIVAVVDTHVHADYISGAPVLARELGVPLYLHPADNVWPYDGTPGRLGHRDLEDGVRISVGGCEVRVGHTPGHTEGSVTLFAGEGPGDAIAFTGDFLFIASIGRPDLAGRTEEWTADLWRSVQRARSDWDPGLRVLPAHYAEEGERNEDRSVGRRFADVLSGNEALRIATEREFRTWVTDHVSEPPDAYPRIKAINVGLAEVTEEQAETLEAGRSECALA